MTRRGWKTREEERNIKRNRSDKLIQHPLAIHENILDLQIKLMNMDIMKNATKTTKRRPRVMPQGLGCVTNVPKKAILEYI
ncbi:hypothetical protein PIB30_107515, partial [Stylosanthes scabra]|nr:hypothetical protein [Stylosanthes scabra]